MIPPLYLHPECFNGSEQLEDLGYFIFRRNKNGSSN